MVIRVLKITFPLIIVFFSVRSQNIENIKLSLEGENLIIQYDLLGDENEVFEITTLGSHNDYSTPLQFISGDVGKEISPGRSKRIVWQAKNELGNFAGDIQIRITAEVIPLLIFDFEGKLKRGKEQTITWEKRSEIEQLRFELFKGESLVQTYDQISNTGNWNWDVPKKIKPGSDFTFKAISLNRSSISGTFTISRKVPLLLKILPMAGGVGGLIAIIASGGNGTEDPPNNRIVDPLLPN